MLLDWTIAVISIPISVPMSRVLASLSNTGFYDSGFNVKVHPREVLTTTGYGYADYAKNSTTPVAR
jgi:hypothetical protein